MDLSMKQTEELLLAAEEFVVLAKERGLAIAPAVAGNSDGLVGALTILQYAFSLAICDAAGPSPRRLEEGFNQGIGQMAEALPILWKTRMSEKARG